MLKFSCRAAGVEGCPWMVYAENADALVRKAREHDEQAHAGHPLLDDERRIRKAIHPA